MKGKLIGEVAKEWGIRPGTLRYYEKLAPPTDWRDDQQGDTGSMTGSPSSGSRLLPTRRGWA